MAEAFAPAKINLTLHVTGQRPDGFHLLDSLVVFADVGDRVTVSPADQTQLTVTGPMAAGVPTNAGNLVLRAAALAGVSANIMLEKHLPTAAGIGGGSSDAAATLRAISQMAGQPAAVDPLTLGADVPVCLLARPTRMSGIGEMLTPVPGLPAFDMVLVNPGLEISTGRVFGALAAKSNAPMPVDLPQFRSVREFCAWLRAQRNDLEPAALAMEPRIRTVFKALSEFPNLLVRMSGSGATCLAVFEQNGFAEIVMQDLRRKHPDWWVASASSWSLGE